MGNTITNNIGPVTVSPPISSTVSGGTVHNVQTNEQALERKCETKSDEEEKKKSDAMHVHVHSSTRTSTARKDAVDGSVGKDGSQTRFPCDTNTNVNENDMSDVNDVLQHALQAQKETETSISLVPVTNGNTHITTHTQERVRRVREMAEAMFDRISTPAHPVTSTYSTVPPVRAEQMSGNDDMLHVVMQNGKTITGSFQFKQIIIRVDTRSPSSHFHQFSLPSNGSNNLTSLRRVLHRASTLTNTTFNPHTMFHGLNQGRVEVSFMTRKGLEQLKEQIKTAKATAATAAAQNGSGLEASSSSAPPSLPSSSSSSSPVSPRPVIPSLWTTQYKLHFDTITNTKTAFTLLTSMGITPTLPYPRIITGTVTGFPFTATNDEIEKHLQQHAWYVGHHHSLSLVPCNHKHVNTLLIKQKMNVTILYYRLNIIKH